MFIGRQREQDFLNNKYQSETGELVVLYGRRRIGKTETLREFARGKEHIFYSCAECTDTQQLHSFSERFFSKNIPAARYLTEFTGWRQALESVKELPLPLRKEGSSGKKLLIIDEFPYMVSGNPSIPSVLQDLWDSGLKDENVMIILCGSSMGFMEKEVLAEKNPLYGRATGILKMTAMTFYEAAGFFPHYSDIDKITAWAILGGIPHYLKQFDSKKTIGENIKENILSRGSILYSEIEFLMRQELRETATYNTIIEAVALGNTKLNDIYTKTGIEKNKLAVYLKNLVDLEIIRREFSVSDGSGTRSNVQRGLYRIADPFFRFWFAFVFPNMSELEAGDAAGIYRHAVAPALDEYVSRAFEDLCREYLRKLNQEDRLPFHFTQIGCWWDKKDELDIMAIGKAADTNGEQSVFSIILGECKYRRTAPFDLSDLKKAMAKNQFKGNPVWFFFSRSGFTAEVQRLARSPDADIRLVMPEDIVKG
ncbi:ATPase AAA [Spirochaetia bacterium]|nr:ATPase AAA [Spirochaetia bacterium]